MPHPLTTKLVPLTSLYPDPSNARAHGPHNLEAIEASVRRFAQAEPLVVQAFSRANHLNLHATTLHHSPRSFQTVPRGPAPAEPYPP